MSYSTGESFDDFLSKLKKEDDDWYESAQAELKEAQERSANLTFESEVLRSRPLLELKDTKKMQNIWDLDREVGFIWQPGRDLKMKKSKKSLHCAVNMPSFPVNDKRISFHTHISSCLRGDNEKEVNKALTAYNRDPLTEAELMKLPYYIPSAMDLKDLLDGSFYYTEHYKRYMPTVSRVYSNKGLFVIMPSRELIDFSMHLIERSEKNRNLLVDLIPRAIEDLWTSYVMQYLIEGDIDNLTVEKMVETFCDIISTNKYDIVPSEGEDVYPSDARLFYVKFFATSDDEFPLQKTVHTQQSLMYCDARDNQICQQCNAYDTKMLKKVAQSLSLENLESLTKNNLCSLIAYHVSSLKNDEKSLIKFTDKNGKNTFLVDEKCFSSHTNGRLGKLLGSGMFGSVYNLKNDDTKVLKIFIQHDVFNDKPDFDPNAEVLKEIELTRKAGELGAGPTVYDYWVCKGRRLVPFYFNRKTKKLFDHSKFYRKNPPIKDDLNKVFIYDILVGFIIMEKLDTSLEDYFNSIHVENPDDIRKAYRERVRKITESGIKSKIDAEIKNQVNLLHKNGMTVYDFRMSNVMFDLDSTNMPRNLKIIDYGMGNLTPTNDELEKEKSSDFVQQVWET